MHNDVQVIQARSQRGLRVHHTWVYFYGEGT